MKKNIVIASMLLLAAFVPQVVRADEKILSPDKSISVDLRTGKGEFGWTVSKNGKKVYSVKDIRLIVDELKYRLLLSIQLSLVIYCQNILMLLHNLQYCFYVHITYQNLLNL